MIIDRHEARATPRPAHFLNLAPTPFPDLQLLGGGTITADTYWNPHVQGTINVAPPADPRHTQPGNRVQLELRQRFGTYSFLDDLDTLTIPDRLDAFDSFFTGSTLADIDGQLDAFNYSDDALTPTSMLLDLIIVRRTMRRDSHTLELASEEHRFTDIVALEFTPNGPTVGDILHHILAGASTLNNPAGAEFWRFTEGPPRDEELVLVDKSTRAQIAADDLIGLDQPGNVWDVIESIVLAVDKYVYSPGDGTLVITDGGPLTGAPLTLAVGVNLIDWDLRDTLTGYAYVQWTGEPGDPDARPVDSLAPSLRLGPMTQLITTTRPRPVWPPAGEIVSPQDNPAYRYGGLLQERSNTFDYWAVNNYAIRPGSSITGPETPVAQARSVTWAVGDTWEMKISI